MNNKICTYVKGGKCTNPCAEAIECPTYNDKDESYDTCDWFREGKPNTLIEEWNGISMYYLEYYPSCLGSGLRILCGTCSQPKDDAQSIRLEKNQVKQFIKDLKKLLKKI